MGLGECCLVNIVSKKLHCVLKDKHSAGFRVAGGTNISTPQHPELILMMYKHPKLILVMYKQQIHCLRIFHLRGKVVFFGEYTSTFLGGKEKLRPF